MPDEMIQYLVLGLMASVPVLCVLVVAGVDIMAARRRRKREARR